MKAELQNHVDESHAPRPLTVKENVVLTIKVLGVVGAILLIIWGLKGWATA